MALRNEKEHSYRTLAMEALRQVAAEGIKKINVPKDGPMSAQERMMMIEGIIFALDYLKAVRWLKELDADLCPETTSKQDEVMAKLMVGADMQQICNDLIEETKLFPINKDGTLDV